MIINYIYFIRGKNLNERIVFHFCIQVIIELWNIEKIIVECIIMYL